MTTAEAPVTVTMPEVWPWLFRLAGPVLGFGAGYVVAPLGRWLHDRFDIAPGPIKYLAALPTGWAVLVTTLLGLAAGIWLAWTARRESLAVTVDGSHVGLSQKGNGIHLRRDDVADVRRDGADLVLTDARGAELARRKASDLPWSRLRAAFERHGYPWNDADTDDRFRRWVDGHPDLGADAHELLRARSRALTDDRRGTAEELAERLQTAGVVVRDREGAQEFRRITGD